MRITFEAFGFIVFVFADGGGRDDGKEEFLSFFVDGYPSIRALGSR